MNKLIGTAAALMMTAALTACGGKGAAGEGGAPAQAGTQPARAEVQVKLATTGNEKHQSTLAAQAFKEKAEELSGGAISVTLYPNSQLGSEREMAEGVKMGSIEMTVVTSDGALPSFVPETQVLSIPYLFSSKEEAYYVLDNFLQDELAPKFEEQGMKHLAFCELGFRHFTNNKKEVTGAGDMEGLAIRVQEAPIWFALADSLKFIATPIPFNELYTALQQGTVDGQENPIASISSSAFDEVQKYMVLDGHTYGAESILMNLNFYNGLTDEQRSWVEEAAAYASEEQRRMVSENEKEMLESIREKGVVICEDPDLQSFRDATAELYQKPEVTALVKPELTEAVRNAVKEFQAGK